MLRFVLALALCLFVVNADVYMYGHMQGSNNRQAENSANRNNANRLMNTQNNNRGGVNVGCRTDQNCANSLQASVADNVNTDPTVAANNQYVPVFYEGSQSVIQWTAQHACGGNEATDPQKTNCNIVLQYACDADGSKYNNDEAMALKLQNGANTNTPNTAANKAAAAAQDIQNLVTDQTGGHESSGYYYECSVRSRNKGLFTADQALAGDTAIYTRQNPNGGRSGLECEEEREYYPYWSPSPWVDVAVLTDNVATCASTVANSQNVKDTYKCTSATDPNQATAAQLNPITQAACTAVAGAAWVKYESKYANSGLATADQVPACLQAPWSRDNHLGNGRDGDMNDFNFTVPAISVLQKSKIATITPASASVGASTTCVFRLRYNISTDDYDPAATTATNNQVQGKSVSPVVNNPTVDVKAGFTGLKLAINTNQFGRTFQDRSHTWRIEAKPAAVTGNIVNLGIRGQRGNIVQRYPSVEYDFVPSDPQVKAGDTLYVQWHGSNTANNGAPGGDGQTGDAGEGTGGTDRSNFVQLTDLNAAFPTPLDVANGGIFGVSTCRDRSGVVTAKNCALIMATSGYYRNTDQVASKAAMSVTLDNAPASLIGGMLITPGASAVGSYAIASTRNNNFSNRSQKTTLTITK